MLRPDFSEIQENGFRVSQFRIFHSTKKEYVGNNLIKQRDYAIGYLTEQIEIYFTLSYVSLRMMFIFIFATMISLLSQGTGLLLTPILALLSIIFFLISRRFRVLFLLGHVGITVAQSIYNSKINTEYNF